MRAKLLPSLPTRRAHGPTDRHLDLSPWFSLHRQSVRSFFINQRVAVLGMIVAMSVCVRAQQSSDTPKQLWPEVDVYVPVDERVRLFFRFSVTKSEETRKSVEGNVGAHVDYTVNHRLVLRAGYRYGFSLNDADPFREHRPLFEQSFRQHLPLRILLTDATGRSFASSMATSRFVIAIA